MNTNLVNWVNNFCERKENMYHSYKDPLYGYFVSCLFDIREGMIKPNHVSLSHETLTAELGTRWRDITLNELITDGFVTVERDEVKLTPKAEQELLLSGITPPKPKRNIVAEQLATIAELEKIVNSEKVRILPVVDPSNEEENGVSIVNTTLGAEDEVLEDVAKAAVLILQAGGYGIICLPALDISSQLPRVYVLPQENKPPRFDITVEECVESLRGTGAPVTNVIEPA